MTRLKILISAHELSPYYGSECAEGWNLVTRIAKYHDVTVLYARGTHHVPDEYEKVLEKYFSENPKRDNIEFIPVAQPPLTLWIGKINKRISKNSSSIGNPFLYFLGYRLWQKAAYKTALSLLGPFDMVHHLTQITFREPGYLWKLPMPFVWGPTGGLTKVPLKFAAEMGWRTLTVEFIRSLINSLTFWMNLRIAKAIGKASLIYTFSALDQELFQKRGAKHTEMMIDAGCETPDSRRMYASLLPSPDSRLRVLWVGQLIRRKALDILLDAVSDDPELKEKVEITIVGDGPLRDFYEQSINNQQTGPHNLISFTGRISREMVFKHMQCSDVLAHTSYREAASNVIPEALSYGLPVICHDIAGMSIAVTDECGIKIPFKTYSDSVTGFRSALKLLIQNPDLLSRLRQGAARRAGEISWDSMAERIAHDYSKIAAIQ